MANGDPDYYRSLITDNTAITTTTSGNWYEYTTPYQEPVQIVTPFIMENNKKGGDEDMRYLYEVILVNPKNEDWYETKVVAKSETSALMSAYNRSIFVTVTGSEAKFDDLKTSCRVLMEWKKEKSLEKALETIKKAIN